MLRPERSPANCDRLVTLGSRLLPDAPRTTEFPPPQPESSRGRTGTAEARGAAVPPGNPRLGQALLCLHPVTQDQPCPSPRWEDTEQRAGLGPSSSALGSKMPILAGRCGQMFRPGIWRERDWGPSCAQVGRSRGTIRCSPHSCGSRCGPVGTRTHHPAAWAFSKASPGQAHTLMDTLPCTDTQVHPRAHPVSFCGGRHPPAPSS